MPAGTAQEEIVEREPQLAIVDDAIDAATTGAGGLVVLEGPAGIGKTSLMREARDRAAGRGVEVLTARGADFEREFGYGVTRQLLERPLLDAAPERQEALLAGAAAGAAAPLGLAPAGGDVPGAGVTAALAVPHSLYWLVSNLAESRPLLLLVDDAHWADPPSLRFLAYLAQRIEGLHAALIVAFRPDEPGADRESLSQLASDPRARLERVPPLSECAVATVVGSRLGQSDGDFAAACEQATGGNPLLLRELIGELEAAQVEPMAGNVDRVAKVGPHAVARSVLLRIGDLGPAAAALARAIAVLGDGAALPDAGAVAELDADTAGRAADALASVGVLEIERPLRFVHPIVREAIYADIPAARRGVIHRRAADVLATRDDTAERVASHLARTEPGGEPAVAERLREAGCAAIDRGAPDTAVTYLRRALAEPPADESYATALGSLGRAELLSGYAADAGKHLAEAVDRLPPGAERARLSLTLGLAAKASDDQAAATRRYEEAMADAEPVDPRLAREIEGEMVGHAWQDPVWAERLLERVPAWQQLPGDDPAELALISMATRMCITKGARVETARALGLRSSVNPLLIDNSPGGSSAVHTGLYGLLLCDEYDAAEGALARVERLGRERGDVIGQLAVEILRGMLALRSARPRDAEAHADRAIAATDATMLHPLAAPVMVALLMKSELAQGRVSDAERSRARYGPEGELPPLAAFNWLLHAEAELLAARGRHEEAVEKARAVGRLDEPGGMINPAVPWRSTAAASLLRIDRAGEARELAAEWLELAEAFGARSAVGEALRGAALVAEDEGARIALLQRSAEVLRESPARAEYAATLCDLGAALRRAGRRGAAQQPLQDAHDIAAAGGAVALAERAADELGAAGARPRRRMHSGADALTASEHRVAERAAAGASNKEIAQELFVTAKTVENHLGRVYMKLDIHSRSELAGAIAEGAPG